MYKAEFSFKITALAGLLTLASCASSPPPPDGTFAALNIEMDNSVGDATLNTGSQPTIFNLDAHQAEIMSNFGASPESKEVIQIPANQNTEFTYIETFDKLPLKCELNFSIHAIPNQAYLLVVGDIPPRPKPSSAIAEIGHILSAGDVPRCYVRRFLRMADGTLKPYSVNGITFEPSAVP